MKFFVLGCNGMAGHMVSLYLKDRGHQVLGFARKKSLYVDSVVGDAEKFDGLANYISDGGFDVVINCIGTLNQAAEDHKPTAILMNSYLPHFLAESTKNTATRIIHLSTDCVFSGEKGGYTESDFCDGKTFYDRTKALGELWDEKNLTIRCSIVGPDLNAGGIGLLNWFMQQEGQILGFTKAIWTGQTTLQLAKTIEAAAMQHVTGLHQLVPDQSISKFALLQLFKKYIRKEDIEILPSEKLVMDKSLIRSDDSFSYTIPSYETMVYELAEWMREHRELYPHYNIK